MSEPADNRLPTEAEMKRKQRDYSAEKAKALQGAITDLEARIKNAVVVLECMKANPDDTLPPLVKAAVKILTGEQS